MSLLVQGAAALRATARADATRAADTTAHSPYLDKNTATPAQPGKPRPPATAAAGLTRTRTLRPSRHRVSRRLPISGQLTAGIATGGQYRCIR